MNTFVLCKVAPRTFVTILYVKDYKFSLISQSCRFLGENIEQRERLNYLSYEGNQLVNRYNNCRREKTQND